MLGFHLVPDEPSREPIQCMAGISEMCSPHTIVVNQAGKRFADESYFQSVVPALRQFDTLKHDYANLPCFLIFDRQFTCELFAGAPAGRNRGAALGRPRRYDRGACRQARHRRRRARKHRHALQPFRRRGRRRGFPARRDALAAGRPFGGSGGQIQASGPLDRPPFYGLELRPSLGTTSAGLLADANGQVLHQRRHPIPGLYASGVVAARTELGAGYQAGLNLASAMTFSYLAVRHMRQQLITAPAARSPWRAGPRSRPPWR